MIQDKINIKKKWERVSIDNILTIKKWISVLIYLFLPVKLEGVGVLI
jgi:hypothetical protein